MFFKLYIFQILFFIFYNVFFTKSSFLFGFNVGWDNNFLIFFNMIKTVIVFIWEKLIFLIYPLKLFSFLFNFLIEILKVFNDIFSKIIHFIKDSLSYLMFQNPLNVDEGFWERLKEIAKMIFAITIGGIVTYFFKEVQNFLLNFFIKISDLLFKIVLRILDIILILSKLFYFIFKNVIIMVKFCFFNL